MAKIAFVILGVLAVSGLAQAAPDTVLRGFGTLGAVHNFSDDVALVRDLNQPAGPRGETSFDMDTRLGLQLDVEWGAVWSGSLQAVSQYNYRGRYTPRISRAFLKYAPQPQHQFRLGRFGWDVYSMSDSRNVGYAYVWVRPPLEYFGKLQIDSLDGLDYQFSRPLSKGLLSGKLYAGHSSDKTAIDEDSYVNMAGTTIAGGHLEYRYRHWLARISYARLEAETDIRGAAGREIEALLASGNPAIVAAIEGMEVDGPEIDVNIVSVSMVYGRGPLQLQMMLNQDTFIDSGLADEAYRGFLTASYRLGAWTPYMTFARSYTAGAPSQPVAASAGGLGENQHSLSLGVRFDMARNLALKLQLDHLNVRDDGRSSVLFHEAQEDWDGHATLLSTTLDFVF